MMSVVLAGCHATVDARWANNDDTVDHWSRAMPNLPIEVRGALPNASNEQIASVIPNAVADTATAVAAEKHAANAPDARLVMELGHAATPSNDSYCAKPAQQEAAAPATAGLTLTLTLCDGSRLVASSRTPINPEKVTVEELPRRVSRLKNLTMIGISRSPAQFVEIQG
jgi:hypothetical protein